MVDNAEFFELIIKHSLKSGESEPAEALDTRTMQSILKNYVSTECTDDIINLTKNAIKELQSKAVNISPTSKEITSSANEIIDNITISVDKGACNKDKNIFSKIM